MYVYVTLLLYSLIFTAKSTLNDFNEDEEVFLDNIYVRKKSKDEIGRGAYKVVYRAKNIQTKKEVAWCEVLINVMNRSTLNK